MLPAPHTPSTSLAQKIRTCFQSRPSLQDVAVHVLQHSLGRMYPWLSIDRAQPVLVTPGQKNQALADALIGRLVTGLFEDYTQGQRLVDDANQPLNVSADHLERTLNDWGPRLTKAYQEALVHYWMSATGDYQTRYLWLSDLLKQTLLATAKATVTLTLDQFEIITQVVNKPEYHQRSVLDGISVYIVDKWGVAGATELEMLRGLVLVKHTRQVDTVLLFTLSGGIQVTDSLATLGTLLAPLLAGVGPAQQMQWRLYQPSGNIFHNFSLTFLAKQLLDIRTVLPRARQFANPRGVLDQALRVITSDFDSFPTAENSRLQRLREALPAWLLQADPDRQMEMSRYAIDLAKLISQPDWKPFDQGIPSPVEFAGKALAEQVARDHPDKPSLVADQINVSLKSPSSATAPFWRVPAAGSWTLSEMAVLGVEGLQATQLELSWAKPVKAELWLTATEAIRLIERAGIDSKYDQLIAEKLKDNAEEVRWRKARFAEQLRLQLPMLALEYSLKYPRAFSRMAYEMVVAVLGPQATRNAGGQAIVLRYLAFTVSDHSAADVALNLFVIGPQDTRAGPHVLYRPMSEVKLIEFSNWEGVLATIASPGPLQHQVLAWLPRQAQALYASGSLAVPGTQGSDRVDFGHSLWTNPGARLADEPVAGDYVEQLFQSSVAAMLIRPDRLPASNVDAQTFWGWVRHYFGMGLVLILPFVGGPVGRLVGWLLVAWFAMEDVQDIVAPDKNNKLPSIIDLLLNIGLLLLSRGKMKSLTQEPVIADALLDEAQGIGAVQEFEVSWQEDAEQLLEGAGDSRPLIAQEPLELVGAGRDLVRGDPQLEQSWSGLYNQLSAIRQAELALYRLKAPLLRERINSGDHRGLYRAGKDLYANVLEEWYLVDDQGGEFHVFNNTLDTQKGPLLVSVNPGEWVFSPEPALPEDLVQSQILAQQRESQLTRDKQLRLDLDAEYARLIALFETHRPFDSEAMQALGDSFAATGKLDLIDELLAQTEIRAWCAKSLLDFLRRRSEWQVIRDYGALHSRFSRGLVEASRNQAVLLASKRNALLKRDNLNGAWFDAANLAETLLDDKRFQHVAPTLSKYAELEQKALAACQEAEQHFLDAKRSSKVMDPAIRALEVPAWQGQRMSLRWKEVQLRTLALLCFEPKIPRYKDATLDVISEVAIACSLRLFTRAELFIEGRFNLNLQLSVLSDVLDTLTMASCRVFYQLGPLPAYLNAKALGEYRRAVRATNRQLEQELVEVYQLYEAATPQVIIGATDSSPHVVIDEFGGKLIGVQRRFPEGAAPTDDYVDIFDPLDDHLVCSFRRPKDSPDSPWTQMRRAALPWPQSWLAEDILGAVGGEANRLWREAEQQFRKISALASITTVSPRLVRVEWLNYADKMIRQRDALIARLRTPATSVKHRDLLDFFRDTPNALYEQILRFQAEAAPMRNRMMLEHFPTSQNLLTLYRAGIIDVVEVESGNALARNFKISERLSGRAAWVAHFEYSTEVARSVGHEFTHGYMKRYADRNTSYAKLKQWTTTPGWLLNVLRGNVDHDIAQTVFFTGVDDLTAV